MEPRWRLEPGLYRNSLNAMVNREQLNVTEAMMREKTYGQAAMLGPEWKPAGIISRLTAELLTKEKSVSAIPQAGSFAQQQPTALKLSQRAPGTTSMPELANAGQQRCASESEQQLATAGVPKHRTDWHLMTRVLPAPAAASPVSSRKDRTTLEDRSKRLPTGRAASIAANSLPRRMALGTSSSPTLAWYPGLENVGKLGKL
mmetsp:Transcript_108724/g.171499  ORF Transcript_108724/g.171499 Transcript_108724/m.171499 type:complete len:202 (+) Transcript_108724:78-683(+)